MTKQPDSSQKQANNPLHGVKLQTIVEELHAHYGWDGLAEMFDFNCFQSDPSIKSTLKFLRKQQWARDKVEALYIDTKNSPWGKNTTN